MNIFRLLGEGNNLVAAAVKTRGFLMDVLTRAADFSHLASILILLQKMKSSSVCFRIEPPRFRR